MTKIEQKGMIEKMAKGLKEQFIDEWGSEPNCVIVHPSNKHSMEVVDIVDTLVGVKIVVGDVQPGVIQFSGEEGRR